MDYQDLIAAICSAVFLLSGLGLCIWYLIKYGVQDSKELRELRKLQIAYYKKQLEKKD